jgi:hypothetical protein
MASSIPCTEMVGKGSPGAPEQGKGGETRDGTRLIGFMPKSKDHHGGCGILQREISSAWRQLGQGKERGKAEEDQGLL